jgi:hypothetical protein
MGRKEKVLRDGARKEQVVREIVLDILQIRSAYKSSLFLLKCLEARGMEKRVD